MRPFLLPALLVLPLAAPAPASDLDERLVESDIEFAEGLARFRYFDLAEMVLQDVRDQGDLSTDNEALVNLTQGLILQRAAELTVVPEDKLDRLTRAIDLLGDWARTGSAFAFHERKPDALKTLADLYRSRGVLHTELDQPDAADDDFRQADEVLEKLRSEYEDLSRFARESGKSDEADRYEELAALQFYHQGLNFIDWAPVSSDREITLERAVEALQEYQWEVEAGKLAAYFAMLHEARATHRLGDTEVALEILRSLLEQAEWFWDNVTTFDASARGLIADLFDQTWGTIARLELELGNTQLAQQTIDTMQQAHEEKDQPFGRKGFAVLLDWAQGLLDAGNIGEASRIVQQVVTEAKGLPEAEQARQLLAIVAGNVAVARGSPDLFIQAGAGFRDRGDHDQAAFQYAKAVATIDTDVERRQYGFDAFFGLGNALSVQKRNLEAALAFEYALDAELDGSKEPDRVESAAIQMYNHFARRFEATKHDFDKDLRDEAADRLIALGIERDLQLNLGREVFAEAGRLPEGSDARRDKYLEAAEEFEEVGDDTPGWESAQVYRARALAGAGEVGRALEVFDAYLAHAEDPRYAPTNQAARARREAALAQALYYKAELLLETREDPAATLAVLEDVEDRVPDQTGILESSKYLRVKAHAMLGDVASTQDAFDDLYAFAPKSSYTRNAAYHLATTYHEASEAAEDPARARELLHDAADAMWRYCELSGFTSFANLQLSGDWYLEAGASDLAERSYTKLLDVFGRRSDVSTALLDEIRIGLARALADQRDFGKARGLWLDLLDRYPRRPRVMRGAALSFGGWLERQDGRIVEVDGSGDYDDAFELWAELFKSAKQTDPHGKTWWEAKLMTIYTLYKQAPNDSQQMDNAKTLLDNVRLLMPNYDGDTRDGLEPERRYDEPFAPYFRYLEDRIP